MVRQLCSRHPEAVKCGGSARLPCSFERCRVTEPSWPPRTSPSDSSAHYLSDSRSSRGSEGRCGSWRHRNAQMPGVRDHGRRRMTLAAGAARPCHRRPEVTSLSVFQSKSYAHYCLRGYDNSAIKNASSTPHMLPPLFVKSLQVGHLWPTSSYSQTATSGWARIGRVWAHRLRRRVGDRPALLSRSPVRIHWYQDGSHGWRFRLGVNKVW
jgi:hypothetical protein